MLKGIGTYLFSKWRSLTSTQNYGKYRRPIRWNNNKENVDRDVRNLDIYDRLVWQREAIRTHRVQGCNWMKTNNSDSFLHFYFKLKSLSPLECCQPSALTWRKFDATIAAAKSFRWRPVFFFSKEEKNSVLNLRLGFEHFFVLHSVLQLQIFPLNDINKTALQYFQDTISTIGRIKC